MIEIGCQTYSLRAQPRDEMLAAVRKAGFRAVELWVGHADWREGAGAAAATRRAVAEVGLTVQAYSVGGFVRVGVDTVAACLAAAFAHAAELGVDLLTGVVDRRAVPVVDALCRRTGMRFGLENHWYADLARPADYLDVLRTTCGRVGVTLDTGHLLAAGGDPLEALEILGDRLFAVHVKDVVLARRLDRWLWRRPRMECRVIGDGDVPLAPFLAALERSRSAARLAIEDERPSLPLSDLQASLRACTGMVRGLAPAAAQATTA